MFQQAVEKVPSGAFSTPQAENAMVVLLTKSRSYKFLLIFGRPSIGSTGWFSTAC
jgi:hypothetical protein